MYQNVGSQTSQLAYEPQGDDTRHLRHRGARPREQLRSQASSTSLNSRQSASRSFETVINMGANQKRQLQKKRSHGGSSGASSSGRGRWATRDNLLGGGQSESVEDDDGDTEDDGQPRRRPPRSAWQDEDGGKLERGTSRTSSATTSDDDKVGHAGRRRRGGDADESNDGAAAAAARRTDRTNSSTMESAQIDRAKSFEYFPGESFPMQENSSSYEYLPGHMVTDRPGTVVSNYQGGGRDEKDDGMSGVGYLSTSSEASSNAYAAGKNPTSGEQEKLTRRRIELGGGAPRGEEQARPELNIIADELNSRSRELLEAHMKKTKHFHKKMKRYINFVSSPSTTPEESRKKQEILDKLLEILTHEEVKLETERPLSSQLGRVTAMSSASTAAVQTMTVGTTATGASSLSEDSTALTTKQVGTETLATSATAASVTEGTRTRSGGRKSTNKKSTTDSSTFTKRQKQASMPAEKAAFHEQKIDQLRALRKEIKRLEEMEYAQLGRSSKLTETSELSSMMSSTSTASSSCRSEKPPPLRAAAPKQSRPKSSSSTRGIGTKVNAGVGHKSRPTKPKDAVLMPPPPVPLKKKAVTGRAKVIQGRTAMTSDPKQGLVKAGQNRRGEECEDFGQTYPTPRTEDFSIEAVSIGIQTETPREQVPPAQVRQPVRDPVAFYLSVSNSSPIKIGKRALKKKRGEEGDLEKENRSILANYIASLDVASLQTVVDPDLIREEEAESEAEVVRKEEDRRRATAAVLTLRDALTARRPDFVERSERRQEIMKRAREQRLEVAERRRRWLEELAKMPASMRSRAPQPEPQPARIQRLFSYREMVEQTRRKYLKLPEVRYRAADKKKSAFQTNRIMRDVYKKRLQENVLRGKVSMVHHRNVVDM